MAFPIPVRAYIARWQKKGLIDDDTAEALLSDLKSQGGGFGLGNTLAVLGAVLLGVAIITLIAANWEAMPRLLRVALIFAVIWGGYLGGAWRQSRGDTVFSPALYLVAAIAFGAGIALIGQMYHLSGDAAFAALVWTGGVMVAAFLLRSGTLAIASMAIAGFYLFSFLSDGFYPDRQYLLIAPLLAALGAGLAWYTKSRAAADLVALFLIAFFLVSYFDFDSLMVLWLTAAVGLALFLLDGFRPDLSGRIGSFGPALAAYGLAAALLALSVMQFEDIMRDAAGRVIFGVVILGLSIGALVLSGRRNPSVRWIAYVAFSLEVLYLAFVTVGTLIGTSGFFLTAGILLLLLAVFVARMERRLHEKNPKAVASI
ncbi:DUF2157 domain-containing protein [Phyllobacterium phragmitis]|uniref:DUF2157 domain-containing protein n=1 Tax=Phyllobacterium phragmitis TaxID=2670329 RepID=A0A2S9INC5_9HYPH|nr:DUF2157 domain-containing protein [Phyllobacterium phragmitis]PRD42026.1 DUF2157 domain-containing protein [Phyllobacterium phragmitis]